MWTYIQKQFVRDYDSYFFGPLTRCEFFSPVCCLPFGPAYGSSTIHMYFTRQLNLCLLGLSGSLSSKEGLFPFQNQEDFWVLFQFLHLKLWPIWNLSFCKVWGMAPALLFLKGWVILLLSSTDFRCYFIQMNLFLDALFHLAACLLCSNPKHSYIYCDSIMCSHLFPKLPWVSLFIFPPVL